MNHTKWWWITRRRDLINVTILTCLIGYQAYQVATDAFDTAFRSGILWQIQRKVNIGSTWGEVMKACQLTYRAPLKAREIMSKRRLNGYFNKLLLLKIQPPRQISKKPNAPYKLRFSTLSRLSCCHINIMPTYLTAKNIRTKHKN